MRVWIVGRIDAKAEYPKPTTITHAVGFPFLLPQCSCYCAAARCE
jgi:hypothetical protein